MLTHNKSGHLVFMKNNTLTYVVKADEFLNKPEKRYFGIIAHSNKDETTVTFPQHWNPGLSKAWKITHKTKDVKLLFDAGKFVPGIVKVGA